MSQRRSGYGSWLRQDNPKKPRSTAHRHEAENPDSDDNSHQDEASNNYTPASDPCTQRNDDLPSTSASLCPLQVDDLDSSSDSISPDEYRDPCSEGGSDVAQSEENLHYPLQEMPPHHDPDVTEPAAKRPRQDFNNLIFPGLTTTKFECLLMCFHLMMRHGLTTVALLDLLKLINSVFGQEVIPESEHIFNSIFKGSFRVEFHTYCPHCYLYLGEISHFVNDVEVRCESCDEICQVEELIRNNFFVYIPMEQQLRSFLESTPDIIDKLKFRQTRCSPPDTISDVFDGSIYKNLSSQGILSQWQNLSVTFNTDGSPVFKSARNSMWPIQFRVNELPPKERFTKWNCMVAGIWFGKQDPDMTVFLTPFILEAKKLYENGFQWKDPSGNIISSKVVMLNCVLDSIAKPKVQCVKQFNGFYGCNYCYHPGVSLPGNVQVKYVMDSNAQICLQTFESTYTVTQLDHETEEIVTVRDVQDRTNESIRREMEEFSADPHRDEIRGVKGVSPLFALKYFDLVFGFSVDYLHAVLIGVCKLVTGLQLDKSSHGEEYYIGLQITEIDARLKAIKPPLSISRRPRSLIERALWKANEWRAYLLFYSLPCLSGILKRAYLNHHCLLVTSIFILLKDNITKEELQSAASYLLQYVQDFQHLYHEVNMNFNVHLLLHLTKCVEQYGPLWSQSAFFFETGNGVLVQLVKGTRAVAKQIARKYVMSACIPEVIPQYEVSDDVIEYCSTIMSYPVAKIVHKRKNVTLPDAVVKVRLNQEEKNAFLQARIALTADSYQRFIKDGLKYHSKHYVRQGEKSNDSVAKLKDGTYAAIERVFESEVGGSVDLYALIRKINIDRQKSVVSHSMGANASHIKVCSNIVYGSLSVVKLEAIDCKVVVIDMELADVYIADVPNFFEKD